MVAVYDTPETKNSPDATAGLHDTVPVYCAVEEIFRTGAAPTIGAVTPGIAEILITFSSTITSGSVHPIIIPMPKISIKETAKILLIFFI